MIMGIPAVLLVLGSERTHALMHSSRELFTVILVTRLAVTLSIGYAGGALAGWLWWRFMAPWRNND